MNFKIIKPMQYIREGKEPTGVLLVERNEKLYITNGINLKKVNDEKLINNCIDTEYENINLEKIINLFNEHIQKNCFIIKLELGGEMKNYTVDTYINDELIYSKPITAAEFNNKYMFI